MALDPAGNAYVTGEFMGSPALQVRIGTIPHAAAHGNGSLLGATPHGWQQRREPNRSAQLAWFTLQSGHAQYCWRKTEPQDQRSAREQVDNPNFF